jgi:hypothetical protein
MSTNDWLTNTGVVVKACDRLDQRLQRKGPPHAGQLPLDQASENVRKTSETSEKYAG